MGIDFLAENGWKSDSNDLDDKTETPNIDHVAWSIFKKELLENKPYLSLIYSLPHK